MRTLFVSLCAGGLLVGMSGCSGLTDSTASNSDLLKGGGRGDAGSPANVDGGNGAHNGMGTGDGVDCKPTDGGRSPCARGDGGDDDGSDNESEDADDNGDDGGAGKCASLDGGPSPCSKGHENDH